MEYVQRDEKLLIKNDFFSFKRNLSKRVVVKNGMKRSDSDEPLPHFIRSIHWS